MTREVQQRVHQREFRERVLDAYRRTCAICRLKRPELLDAAHIEVDGPMLIHGSQGWNGKKLSILPVGSKRPDPQRLEVRYQAFLSAYGG